jgi:predicted DNA-binding transcriptional regulator AlpA
MSKLADTLAYPPRGFNAERAAAYVGVSLSTFLRQVEEGIWPRPRRIKGAVVWDRLSLDAAFDNLAAAADEENTALKALEKMGM